MPLTDLPDGTVQHAGPGACGKIWHAADGQTARDRASRCPDLNDEMLATVVGALAALAVDYQSALGASLEDRAVLHSSVAAIAQQVAALSATNASLAQQVATLLAAKTTIKHEVVQSPAISLLQGSVDVAITWKMPFPDANYVLYPPSVVTQGIQLLGKVGAVKKSQTASGCVVTVSSSSLVQAGAVEVHALAYRVGA